MKRVGVFFIGLSITISGMERCKKEENSYIQQLLKNTPSLLTLANTLAHKKLRIGNMELEESDAFLKFDFEMQEVEIFEKTFPRVILNTPRLKMSIKEFCLLANEIDKKK